MKAQVVLEIWFNLDRMSRQPSSLHMVEQVQVYSCEHAKHRVDSDIIY